ncbi:hypothetical protein F5Y14DRAFT_396852 [Nemania sp. NC0429]|nr:hypothetical protein F5Y14DRAFT_396852 [Nemania sp. NC0429]
MFTIDGIWLSLILGASVFGRLACHKISHSRQAGALHWIELTPMGIVTMPRFLSCQGERRGYHLHQFCLGFCLAELVSRSSQSLRCISTFYMPTAQHMGTKLEHFLTNLLIFEPSEGV